MPATSINKLDVAAVMKMPPTKALEYFQNLGIPIDAKFAEQALMRARARAFTVANINNAKVTDLLYQEILEAIKSGQTADAFLKRVKPALKEKGWLNDALPAYRLKQMMRSNMQTSFNAGRFQSQKASMDAQPWWVRIEIIDERTRPTHKAVHLVAARADDPFWNENYPPYLKGKFEHGCRARVAAMSERRFQAFIKNNDVKIIESTGNNASKSAFDNEDEIINDGIRSIESSEIQAALAKKLGRA